MTEATVVMNTSRIASLPGSTRPHDSIAFELLVKHLKAIQIEPRARGDRILARQSIG